MSGPDYNPTLWAVTGGIDPLDYYRNEGFRAFISTKLVNQTSLLVTYRHFQQFSMPVATDYNLFDDKPVRDNPQIDDGKLRSIAARFTYDSRQLLKNKRRYWILGSAQYTLLRVGVEYASPDFIDNDFDFRRYYISLFRRQRTLGMGLTSLFLYAGGSDGELPPQKHFTVDFGDVYLADASDFMTFDENNFGGNRALVIGARHEFRNRLWVSSGIPLVKDVPFWLSLHGGVCWTDFKNHAYRRGDEFVNVARKPYSEIGFGLGNLTPFIAPFNLAVYFTWQLSDYDTSDFSIALGIDL
jgi:hypothetical protein